jgi:hypothetical protein
MNDMNTFLEELYEIEPSLRSRDPKELMKIMSVLSQTRPTISMSPQFKRQLRTELMQKIASTTTTTSSFEVSSFFKVGGTILA